jgi:AcrR family transcriptional regulator
MVPRRPDSGTTDVRGAILEAATALFVEKGPDALSMREVAGAIGYSATTIYLHFEDKNALMVAVCASGFEEFGASMEGAARSAASPYDGLRASAGAYVTFALDNPVLYDVMFVRPKEWALEAPGDPASFRGLTQVVGGAMAMGQLRAGDPREAAAVLWSVLHGVVSLALVFRDQIAMFDPDIVRTRALAAFDAQLAALK